MGAGENGGQGLDRMNLPREMPIAGGCEVRYSDLDYSGHVNNSVHSDIFYGYVPGDMHGCALREFQIHYMTGNHEGEVLQIQYEERDD